MQQKMNWEPWALLAGLLVLAALMCITGYVGAAILIPLAFVLFVALVCGYWVYLTRRRRGLR